MAASSVCKDFTPIPITDLEEGAATATPSIPKPKGAPTEFQSLVKGDRVFTLTEDYEEVPTWTNFFGFGSIKRLQKGAGAEKSPKFTTGTVVLNRERNDSISYLSIRWENGKFERLTGGIPSKQIGYGNRLFVLDRDYVGRGSKVFLAGYPEIQGTVKEKRFLATGWVTENPEVIFEDVDVAYLHQATHGKAFDNLKILYKDKWLGITFSSRTRLHLKPVLDSKDTKFCLVLDGNLAKGYNVGDEITLGFNLLRSGKLTGDDEIESTHWLLNMIRFMNVEATIHNIELDELQVHWIGKADEPQFDPTSFDFPDSPPKKIPYSQLHNVQYLSGAKQFHVTPGSIWKYKHDPNCNGVEDAPVSKKIWASKWLKLVDLDRWVYPIPDDIPKKTAYWGKELMLEVMYLRSVVDVAWKNGVVNTLNSGDVIPMHLVSVWSDWALFRNGTIVWDRMDRENRQKYGVILAINDDETATVNWIQPSHSQGNELMTTELSKVPLYDLVEKNQFDYLTRLNQSPIVALADGSAKVGVVVGMRSESGKVKVKVSGKREVKLWPHQLTHFRCDVMLCPSESCWTAWYDHIVTPPHQSQPAPEVDEESSAFQERAELSSDNPKKRFTRSDQVPTENIFFKDCKPLNAVNSMAFPQVVEKEVKELQDRIPNGIWVEYYMNPGNVMSALIVGPQDSIFEDMLFIFDIILLQDFPRTLPHINFRSLGATILPNHFCKTGAVYLGEESKLGESEMTTSEVVNLLMEVKEYMGIPLEEIIKMDHEDPTRLEARRHENPHDLSKFVLMSVLDYTITLLHNPPENWSSVVLSHYSCALPRIIKRVSKTEVELRKAVSTKNMELGDCANIDANFELVTQPQSDTYTESIGERVQELEKISARINSV